MNDESVEGLAKQTENERFAWDSYRRFVQMFGNVARGMPGEAFEDAIKEAKEERGVETDTDLDTDDLKALTQKFKEAYKEHTDEDFPQDPEEQLRLAIRAVFDSWTGERAVSYRRLNRIPDDWGTAVNVQQMVFGNKGDNCATGVAFSRDEVTGEQEPSGDFLVNAQGEDVVSGVRNTRDIAELKDVMPEAHEQLMEILGELEKHYKDMQDTEFTIEDGQLFMLQTRNAKRPAQAAVRFACDAVDEGLLSKEEALLTIDPSSLDALLHPTFDPKADFEVLAVGRLRLARRRQGRGRVHGQGGGPGRAGRPRRHPRAAVHRGRRRRGLPRRQGHPHVRGRQGLARRARGARDGPPGGRGRERAEDRPRRQDDLGQRHHGRGGRLHRHRRHQGLRDGRGRGADRRPGRRVLRPRARVGRRAAPAEGARQRRRPGRARRRRASWGRRASACAGPSTCSWPRTASPRCGR